MADLTSAVEEALAEVVVDSILAVAEAEDSVVVAVVDTPAAAWAAAADGTDNCANDRPCYSPSPWGRGPG